MIDRVAGFHRRLEQTLGQIDIECVGVIFEIPRSLSDVFLYINASNPGVRLICPQDIALCIVYYDAYINMIQDISPIFIWNIWNLRYHAVTSSLHISYIPAVFKPMIFVLLIFVKCENDRVSNGSGIYAAGGGPCLNHRSVTESSPCHRVLAYTDYYHGQI